MLIEQPLFGGLFPQFPLLSSKKRTVYTRILGRIPKMRIYSDKGKNFFENFDPLFESFEDVDKHSYDVIKNLADYRHVRPRWSGINLSLGKTDVPPKNPANIYYNIAKDYTLQHLALFLKATICTDTVTYNMSTSPGAPFTWMGLKTKEEALGSDLFKVLQEIDYVPLYSCYDKAEFLPLMDLERDKIRTMFSPDLVELMWQKIFFQEQNESLKLACDSTWLKYGLVKQYGGFGRFIEEIGELPLRFEGDISGWDRCVDVSDVYDIRTSCLDVPEEMQLKYFQVVLNILNSIVIFPTGDLVEMATGNRSGQNNTALDNSIKHIIIKFYQLIRLRVDNGFDVPSYNELMQNVRMGIYSDDFLMSLDEKFFPFSLGEVNELMVSTYLEFGLVMKPSASFSTNSWGLVDKNHSFLGSNPQWDVFFDAYLPVPRFGKVCSSIVYKPMSKIDGFDFLVRLVTLLSLTYVRKEVFYAILNYLKYAMSCAEDEDLDDFHQYLGTVHLDLSSVLTFSFLLTGREMEFVGYRPNMWTIPEPIWVPFFV